MDLKFTLPPTIRIAIRHGYLMIPLCIYGWFSAWSCPGGELNSKTTSAASVSRSLWDKIPHFRENHREEIIFFGTGILLICFFLFLYSRIKQNEMRRDMALLFSFPGRVGVCDIQENILFFHDKDDPDSHMKLKKMRDIPDTAYSKISKAIAAVFADGKPLALEYEYNNVMRAMMIAPLSEKLFGKRCIVWYSYENIELQQARLHAEELAEHLHLTLQSIGDAVMVTDRNGVITLLNPVAERLTGYHREEAIGMPHETVFRIISYLDNSPVKSPLRDALSLGTIAQLANHTDLIAKNGTRRHIADSAAPIRTRRGEITGGILIFRDVTEEYNKRDRLRDALNLLEIGSELTRSVTLRVNMKTGDVEGGKLLSRFWTLRGGKPVPPEEIVYPPDLETYKLHSDAIYRGEKNEDVWNYRALIDGTLRYFRMQVKVDRSLPDEPYLTGVIQDVTDITRNLLKLKEHTELWELAVNAMPIMTFVKNCKDDFRYVAANSFFAEFIGCPAGKIIGQTDFDLFSDRDIAGCFRKKDEEVITGGIGQEFIERPLDAGGNIRHLRTTKIPFLNGDGEQMLLGIAVDLTELNAFSANEKVINFCLETFFKTEDPDEAVHQILETVCLHMNATRAYMLHFDLNTKQTSCFSEYAANRQPNTLSNYHAIPFNEEEAWMQLLLQRQYIFLPNLKDPEALALLGTWKDFVRRHDIHSLYASGIFVNGKLWGNIGLIYEHPMPLEQFNFNFLQTIQHLLEVLLERKQAQEKILNALQAARAADRAKSYFIATVSHEIRTPLNAVIGLSELLRDNTLDEQTQREYLDGIACSGNALLQLINDVLDLSKLEAGQMKIDPHPTDCSELCREILSIFRYSAECKGLSIRCSAPPMPHLCIDKLRIRQILFNLLGNAVKFTKKGGIEVHAEFHPENSRTGTFRFRVSDTGSGIAPEEQHNLFDPFVQAGTIRGTYASGNGTGLGLAIAKRLLDRMKGNISLTSVPGQGTSFLVEIKEVEYKEPDRQSPRQEQATLSLRDLRILIVDDVPLNVKVLEAMLKNLGCQTFSSTSGSSALEFLSAHDVDWVLTDLWMPDMNGAELAAEIRRRNPEKARSIKIAAVSADIESHSNFDMSCLDAALSKPVSIEKLKKLLSASI